jgi:hypothetical protein
MDTWYKATLPFAECGIAGKGQKLQDAFAEVFIMNAGPWDAAMFSQRSDDFTKMFYYFTPGALRIARSLIEALGIVPCPVPLRGSVSLAVGDARAFDMLTESESKKSAQA